MITGLIKHASLPQELPRVPVLPCAIRRVAGFPRALRRVAAPARVGALATLTAALVPLTGCAPPVPASPLAVSWNSHVKAPPLRTTLPRILGATTNAKGGPTRAGGWYGGTALADRRQWVGKQVVSGRDQKRMVPPPATVAGMPVFVEVDNLEIVWIYDNAGVPGTDHDTSGNACMVGRPRSNLTCIHIEIDGRWKARGWAPPDFPLHTPIDVQGYVYWDNPHDSEGVPMDSAPSGYRLGHYETGWEIHPVSAWRIHQPSAGQ